MEHAPRILPEPARDVALRILDACFADDAVHAAAARDVPGLEAFQADACHRLRVILDRRGGAILADSVGLGKTHVAAAIIRDELVTGGTALVVAPAQLRAHWKRHLRDVPPCRWVSHSALSRGGRRIPSARLIVVDEAHGFRNPHARRYASLAMLCENARVLLLTATPVNNSLLDFYHLVHLFAPRDLFADIGVPDLLAAVESALRGGSGAELRRVADAVMVRRTRRAVSYLQSLTAAPPRPVPAGAPPIAGAPTLRFPSSSPIEVVRYDLGGARTDLIECVRQVIPALMFPAHCLTRAAAPCELMRLGLLKRLESSTWALHASVRRHARLLDHFIAAAREGLLFDPREDRVPNAEAGGAVQLSLDAIALRKWPASLDRAALTAAAEHDLHALRQLSGTLAGGSDGADAKLERLCALLDSCDDKVLLFTEYQETACGLWRSLASRPGIALVHGGDARLGRGRSSRRAIVERFAPVANGARTPRSAEHVDLLIATDVLAEGLNLQDARVVLSYDLPWNPVRLAQRIGRIDRLGSPHERIRAVAFMPDHGVDELLGLMKRIRRKLRDIRVVGGDAPWSLAGARRSARYIEDIDAAAEARERVRAMWRDAATDGTGRKSRAPAVGVLPWRGDRDGALCCFRVGGAAVLVLMMKGRRPEAGSAQCWSTLADALAGGGEDPGGCVADGEEIAARAAAFFRAARNALRGRRSRHPRGIADPAAVQASTTVLRWLASRPGGASADDAEKVDSILCALSAGARAGAHIRVQRLLHDSESMDHAVQSLAREPRGSGCGPDRSAAGRCRSLGGSPSAGSARTGRPHLPGPEPVPEPIGLLLLRAVADRAG